MMTYIIIQIFCVLGAFLGLGQSLDKKATKFDKVFGYVICFAFLIFILYIEGVLKR